MSAESSGVGEWRIAPGIEARSLPRASFGAVLSCDGLDTEAVVSALEARPEALPEALMRSRGLLVLAGMRGFAEHPELLVRLSRLLGPEVENYRETLTPANMIHDAAPEILVLSNRGPSNRGSPPRPDPPLTPEGELPVEFPQRRGWHTDQSFRRPPPDISLLYAVVPCPKGQGQTLFADGTAGYETLPARLKERVAGLYGLHALLGTGRSETAVRSGEQPKELLPHQRSQRQPVARVHPITGKRALYLCESGQMDWLDGPLLGLPPGPDGEGARLLYALMTHATQPQLVYVHDWDLGDLVIYDNRSLMHAGTWYDAENHERLMWRTTVMGNPGEEYAGEKKSWLPEGGQRPMDGLGNLQWSARQPTARV